MRLYTTDNGGKTWVKIDAPVDPDAAYTWSYAPAFQKNGKGTVPVIYGNQDGSKNFLQVYHTQNSGKDWAPYPALATSAFAEFRHVTFRNAREGWSLGLDSTGKAIIHRTTDGGFHWQTVRPIGLGSITEVILDGEFVSATQGWMVNKADDGTLSLFQTSDGGKRWSHVKAFVRG